MNFIWFFPHPPPPHHFSNGPSLTVHMKKCLTPKNPKMCDPILETLLKIRPHYSQPSRENVTPSSGTSQLTFYKEVALLPGEGWMVLAIENYDYGIFRT